MTANCLFILQELELSFLFILFSLQVREYLVHAPATPMSLHAQTLSSWMRGSLSMIRSGFGRQHRVASAYTKMGSDVRSTNAEKH